MDKKKLVECKSLDIRVTEDTARKLDALLPTLPQEQRSIRRKSFAADVKVIEGEREDVSTVTSETVDREGEKILAMGIDLSDYEKNPVVLFNHQHDKVVGKCRWIKSEGNGLIAKTWYAPRPADHQGQWFPDDVWGLVKQQFLVAKSIGFIPIRVRASTTEERQKDGEHLQAVCESSLLLEYSCVGVPANPDAVVQAVTKKLHVAEPAPVQRKRKPVSLAKLLDGITFDADEIAERVLALRRGRV